MKKVTTLFANTFENLSMLTHITLYKTPKISNQNIKVGKDLLLCSTL